MKIGILTITEGVNYGNRLQNYALQKVLEDLGHEVETIKMITYKDKFVLRKIERYYLKQIVRSILRRKSLKHNIDRRKQIFKEFNDKYVKFSDFSLKDNAYNEELNINYDCFICGSDQVWNANFRVVSENIKNHLAWFASDEKRISYSASFGTSSLAEGYEETFKKELNKFKAISVREESGQEIVESLIGKKAELLVDPTMLVCREQWHLIAKKPDFLPESKAFIFTYFLGGRNERMRECLRVLGEEGNLVCINAEGEKWLDIEIEDIGSYAMGPEEFIWCIEHAEMVLTDSFHACVYAILFNKPYTVFERIIYDGNNMGTRIDMLLDKFHMTEHKGDMENPVFKKIHDDPVNVQKILESERKKSMDFFLEVLG